MLEYATPFAIGVLSSLTAMALVAAFKGSEANKILRNVKRSWFIPASISWFIGAGMWVPCISGERWHLHLLSMISGYGIAVTGLRFGRGRFDWKDSVGFSAVMFMFVYAVPMLPLEIYHLVSKYPGFVQWPAMVVSAVLSMSSAVAAGVFIFGREGGWEL